MTEANTRLIIAYDVGTTSLKTCVYRIGTSFTLITSAMSEYGLRIFGNAAAEQDPEDWYQAMVKTTNQLFSSGAVQPGQVAAVTFCSQMQGLVLVDKAGNALRPAMSYMDGRAGEQKSRAGESKIRVRGRRTRAGSPEDRGFRGIRIEGLPVWKLLRAIQITGIAPTSVKDPVWKYHWVRDNEPQVFEKVYKWLDVKEYLIMRLTGNAVMTRDSAGATFMYDTRRGRQRWSTEMCRMFGIDIAHLPKIIRSDETAGTLREHEAHSLGLLPGIPVFGGGGDASLIGLGAGAVDDGDIHIYMGTSGWVSAVTSKRRLDLKHFIGSITCAVPGKYHYFSEQETAGKCMEWVSRHLALDEIGVYLNKREVTDDPEAVYTNLFEYLSEVVSETPPGCGGVLFTPWLHGSRSPFEDSHARGMFFNIGLNTGKRMLIRAVVEGLGYNLRWMLESLETGMTCKQKIQFVGGGAQSLVTAQILADILGRPIDIPEDPQNSGALGAALVAALGLGILPSYSEIPGRINIHHSLTPQVTNSAVYEKNYHVFKQLYRANRRLFHQLNSNRGFGTTKRS